MASAAGVSGEIPTTSYPCPLSEAIESRKSHAWVVHPGVIAAGYAYRITLRLRRSPSDNCFPSSVGSAKSGASSPGWSRTGSVIPASLASRPQPAAARSAVGATRGCLARYGPLPSPGRRALTVMHGPAIVGNGTRPCLGSEWRPPTPFHEQSEERVSRARYPLAVAAAAASTLA